MYPGHNAFCVFPSDGQPGIPALRIDIDRSASHRKSEWLFVGFGNRAKGGPVMKQRISRWLVYPIILA